MAHPPRNPAEVADIAVFVLALLAGVGMPLLFLGIGLAHFPYGLPDGTLLGPGGFAILVMLAATLALAARWPGGQPTATRPWVIGLALTLTLASPFTCVVALGLSTLLANPFALLSK